MNFSALSFFTGTPWEEDEVVEGWVVVYIHPKLNPSWRRIPILIVTMFIPI